MHIEHCLDSLRQDIMCKADDTPMPTVKIINGAGDDQVMQCKDFNKVIEWAQSPEHDACYKHVNEFAGVHHGVERFAFCKEDSPFYPSMSRYFEKHGHKDEIVEPVRDLM